MRIEADVVVVTTNRTRIKETRPRPLPLRREINPFAASGLPRIVHGVRIVRSAMRNLNQMKAKTAERANQAEKGKEKARVTVL